MKSNYTWNLFTFPFHPMVHYHHRQCSQTLPEHQCWEHWGESEAVPSAAFHCWWPCQALHWGSHLLSWDPLPEDWWWQAIPPACQGERNGSGHQGWQGCSSSSWNKWRDHYSGWVYTLFILFSTLVSTLLEFFTFMANVSLFLSLNCPFLRSGWPVWALRSVQERWSWLCQMALCAKDHPNHPLQSGHQRKC